MWRVHIKHYITAILSLWAVVCYGSDLYVIPFDVDPPIQIDGDLSDWSNVPGALVMQDKSQVTWKRKPGDWTGPEDCSAIVRLAWRQDGLKIAAQVTDERVQQPFADKNLWKGDYINVILDMQPTLDPNRELLGLGQYQLAFSPGDFKEVPAVVHLFQPQGLTANGCKIVSVRTDKGYTLEAFVPFDVLQIKGVHQDQYATFEIGISDSDTPPYGQQAMMTVGTSKWQHKRTRLLPILFGDGNGHAEPPTKTHKLVDRIEIAPSKTHTIKFNVDQVKKGMESFLFFKAVSQYQTAAGYCTSAITVAINGKPIEPDRCTNRPAEATLMNGHSVTILAGNGHIMLPWAPDFTSTDTHKVYAITGQVKAAEYEFYIGDLTKPGENILTIKNNNTSNLKYQVLAGDIELRLRPHTPGSQLLKPAPIGPLPVYQPRPMVIKPWQNLQSTGQQISLTVNGQPYKINSKYSTPDGKWVTGSNTYFNHQRQITEHDQWIEVRDTFTNLTQDNLPLMYMYQSPVGKQAAAVWLAGRKISIKTGEHYTGDNPSAFAATKQGGIGLIALNDEFRAHVREIAEEGSITLQDRSFVLQPGKSYTAQIAIIPTTSPDFWDFINTARRMLDVNIIMDLMFATAVKREPVYDWSNSRLKNYIENKSANFIVQSNYGVKTKQGKPARSTDWLDGPHDVYRDMQKRVRKLFPGGSVKTGIYFHCFLDTTEQNKTRFAADRALNAAGEHIIYGAGHKYMSLYIPTLEPGHWGEEIAKVVDTILDDIGADGIYWDEFAWSTQTYVYSHFDGCSADIDWKTHKIKRLKGSTALLSREFRDRMVRRIMDSGAPLLVNGAPWLRSIAKHKFHAFTESGSISHCRGMLLYMPIALGDHITERKPVDAYKTMLRALDHGCLYAWYSTSVAPQYKMLTEHMFPCTPIEIHSGYIIGKERIITNRSGLFGWGDTCEFNAYVYDRQGKLTDQYKVTPLKQDGKVFAQVRMPEGYSAAIVRKQSPGE